MHTTISLSIWLLVAGALAFFIVPFAWEADIAWAEESLAFCLMVSGAFMGWWGTRPGKLHSLYLQDNAGPGLIKAAVWISFFWIAFTLFFFGADRITLLWYWYYLLIGLGCVYVFGIYGTRWLGFEPRRHAYLNNNTGAGLVIAAFMLSTGLIYGGSVWGESEPESFEAFAGPFESLPSYEEGGWIIALFFLLGWIILFLVMKIWFLRNGDLKRRILRGYSLDSAKAASLYCLGCAIPLTSAVAGDYHGLGDSLIGFSAIALPVLAGEIVRPLTASSVEAPRQPWLYLATGIAAAIASPIASTLLGFR